MIRERMLRDPALGPALVAFGVAAGLALGARGLAGDEEAGHYLMGRYGPVQPELFLSMAGRPLITLILALPAQLGFLAARLAGALATGATAYALARLIGRAGWVSPMWAVVLLLVQPFFLAHAGAAMTEPWTAAILAWGLVGFVERRPGLLAILAALAPLARTESLVLWPFAVWVIAHQRARWLLVLPVPLLLWNLAGAIQSGDPIWLLHQSRWQAYPQRDAGHYLRSAVWILGLGAFVPVLVGLGHTLLTRLRGLPIPWLRGLPAEEDPDRRRLQTAAAVVACFFFAIYTALAAWHPITYGNLRYFSNAAPFFAVLGAVGAHQVSRSPARRLWVWITLAVTAILAGLLWNHPLLRDFTIMAAPDYLPLLVVALWIGGYALPSRTRGWLPALILVAGTADAFGRHGETLHLKPTDEQAAVERASRLLPDPLPEGVAFYNSHLLFSFYRDENWYDRSRFPALTESAVSTATPGSLLFWETHYTQQRARALNIQLFFPNPAWRYLGGVISADSTWAGAIFTPTEGAESVAGLVQGGMEESAWRTGAAITQSGVPFSWQNVARDPDNPEFWRVLGQRLSTVGRHREAWSALDRAIALDPKSAMNHAYRAEILRFRRQFEPALESARTALALDPEDPVVLYLNGRLLLDLERTDESIPFLKRAADRLPKRWDMQFAAGKVLFTRNRFQEAEPYLLTTLDLQPAHLEAAILAARSALQLGKNAEARTLLRDYIRRRPEEATPYLFLGDILVSAGERNEAREVWTAGLEKTGGDASIASRLDSLRP